LDDYETLDFQGSFTTLKAAEKSIYKEPPDIAFIRIGKAELNVFKLVSVIRDLNLFAKFILLSNQEEYAIEAFEYEADGFLLIPFSKEKIKHLLQKGFEMRRA